MTLLDSFPSASNVAIIGATGGVGRAILSLLAQDVRVRNIYAFSRTPFDPAPLETVLADKESPSLTIGRLDLEDESSIAAAAEAVTEPLDLVIVTSGILWRGEDLLPEKSMRDLSAENLARVFAINTTGPVLIAKHFLPRMRRKSRTVFAALSARVGSIGDNRLGGWYSYRASKAALNMLLKSLSIEHARRFPESVVAGLHPGTVDTHLSRPFTSRTPADRLFTAESSARHLLSVVNKLVPEDSGGVFAWDGSRIEN